ncbi:hypothetical protein N7492_002138 [Penicillium capsulatum]|uniref:Uncharacterized protein n=1 Tax=Penicillium capsulatum TaxID=69766 RepID=A0A9W9LUV0_9EURO|nr:hypothetical protein N7492_002138 [Penicillium capsulatum]KAJ6123250.1 hypothetical protein N7512_005715 [Penicillium capsulatum]
MPRPAPKRTRQAKGALAHAETCTQNDSTAKSPERGSALDPRALRQTPLTKSHDQAIESSPTGDRTGTGSRPPTRSRGYSASLSLVGRQGEGSSRVPGTPGYDSSVLSNFRRRPRQQSILQMVQAEDNSSELDDDDFLGGLSPQDESTPLNLSRGKSLLVQKDQSPSPSESPPSSAGSRKRKRPEEIQVPASLPEPSQDIVQDSPNATPIARRREESYIAENTPQPQFSDILSQTMAPPASSPFMSTQGSTTGRAPSPQVVLRKSSGGKKKKDPAHLSTATLQDKLLPRRRPRRRPDQPVDEYDISSDQSDTGMHYAASGDEDELNYQPSRRRGRSSKPQPLSNAREKSKSQNQKQKKATAKTSGPATYASARRSGGVDKENEQVLSSPGSPLTSAPDSDASDAETGKRTPRRITSEELRAAARKFAEVDQWKLEFEEVEDVSASEM